MIVRILGEGQWDVPEDVLEQINVLDGQLERAVEGADVETFRTALEALLDAVRDRGSKLPDDALEPSEAILPGSDASMDEVRELLTDEGLIPG
ncbi:MAG: PspA-associated protein PspAA [Actinomycetes bacterium]